jgi:hypothetical protein
VRARGEEITSEPESSGSGDEEDEDEIEGAITPPHSLPPKDIPSLGDLFS